MKKNISINISGIIFHIEEDGYDKLKEYLESINRYFSTFDDSLEIVADIESRIAEIFLAKLKEGSQVITIEDVESLMATMGSIKDFQAAEEDTAYIQPPSGGSQKESQGRGGYEGEHLFDRKLFRDKKRKLLAGVLAGLAYYFNIDPIWTRLFYIILFFGISVLPSIGGILFIAYIVMWIVVPASDELHEEKKIKKMYRDPDKKVLGGVAGGMAAYFGIDVVIVRLLFFAAIFFAGTGLILYIILWIILPEARTLTDKMEMQGQPVTLSNIESNIKKSLNVEGHEENLFVKVLLFPFRLVAALFSFLNRALVRLMIFVAEAIRVIFGILLILLGFSGILSVLITAGILVGLVASGDQFIFYHIPTEVITNDIHLLPGIALAIFLIVPFLYLSMLGFSIIMRKTVIRAKVGWSLLALWLASLIVFSFTVPPFIKNFQRDGIYTQEKSYDVANKTIALRLSDIGQNELNALTLNIEGYDGNEVKITETYKALGPSREEALQNARQIQYNYNVQDSVFTFDSDFSFKPGAVFRNQELDITCYLPKGEKFVMDDGMRYLLGSYLYRNGFSNGQIAGNQWMFSPDGKLVCLTCPVEETTPETSEGVTADDIQGNKQTYDLKDFSEIEINDAFHVIVKKSDQYKVVVNGRKEDLKNVVLEKTGEELSVKYKSKIFNLADNRHEIKVYVFMPELHRVKFGGACRSDITGFDSDQLEVGLSGAALSNINVNVQYLDVDLSGASRLDLSGNGRKMEVKVSGASAFNAFGFEANEITVNASSAASANVNATDNLDINGSGNSNVRYKGGAQVNLNEKGSASAEKEE